MPGVRRSCQVTDGLRTLLKVCDETFATDAFQARSITKQLPLHPPPLLASPLCSRTISPAVCVQESMKQCFVGVGLAKDQTGEFIKYINHRKGKLATPIKKVDTDEQSVTFGEVVAEVELLWGGARFREIFCEICPAGWEREISRNIPCLGAGARSGTPKVRPKPQFL